MNDSAYMSQPGSSRHGAPKSAEGSVKGSPQDYRPQALDQYYANTMYSPSLSTVSSQPFPTQTDMSQMSFPQTAWDTPQTYGFPMTGATEMWRPADAQVYMPYTNGQDIQTTVQTGEATMLPPSAYPYYGDEAPVSPVDQRPFKQERPRLQRANLSANSANSRDTNTSTPLSAVGSDHTVNSFNQAYGQREHSQQFVQTGDYLVGQNHLATNGLYEAQEDDIAQDDLASLEDSETTKLARTHPLYQASPGADDLYHCPHEGEPGCTHKATKLKCNYDKYVDSHLRPFRCKVTSCANTPFSSTACLLRHEREAHGMHGHGSKPHLCLFPDCERSLPTNGFPRRYNLFDHMKRVHDYTGTEPPTEQEVASTTVSAAPKKPTSRKRKTDAPVDAVEKRQKSVSTKPAPPPVDPLAAIKAQRAEQRRYLQQSFDEQREIVINFLKALNGPQDLSGYTKFKTGADTLGSIMQQASDVGTG